MHGGCPALERFQSRKERTVTDHLSIYLVHISSTSRLLSFLPLSNLIPLTTHFSLITTNLPTNTNNTAKMTELKAGDNFPEGVFFSYIPPTPEISKFSTCGTPVPYNASQGT